MKNTTESLAAMSDFEVNKALAGLIAWSEPNCKNVTFEGGCFWVEHVGFSSFKIENYCNNPSDVMPLVFELGINLQRVNQGDSNLGYWLAGANTYHSFADKNPMRAAACCLILVLQENK